MGKVIPMISKLTKQIIINEALVALDCFKKTGSREGFKKWQKEWEEELVEVRKAKGEWDV